MFSRKSNLFFNYDESVKEVKKKFINKLIKSDYKNAIIGTYN